MSWAGEEWKDGLNHKVLTKINEIEKLNEKLKKETRQKQYQIESLDAAFGKQKKKIDDEKSEVTILKRENNSLTESCVKLEQKINKLVSDIRHKDSHINSLEGQLERCKRQIDVTASKVTKKDNIQQEDQRFQLKIKELQSLLDNERTKCAALERKLSDFNKSKPTKSSYVPSLPWATDDVVSTPKKPTKQPMIDLLTGSPIHSAGAGDALISLSNQTHAGEENLRKELESANKRIKELEQKNTSNGDFVENQREITKLKDDLMKNQIQLDQARCKVAEQEKNLQHASELLKCEQANAELCKTSLQDKLLEVEKHCKQEVARITETMKSMEKQLNDNQIRHKKGLVSVESDLKQAQCEIEQKSLHLNKVESELKKCKQQLLQMEQMHQSDGNKIANLNEKIKELQSSKDETLSDLMQAKSINVAKEKCLQDEKRNVENAQLKLTNVQQLLDSKVMECENLKKSLDEKISLSGNQVENLKIQLADVESKKVETEKLLKSKDNEMLKLSAQLSSLQTDSSQSKKKLEEEGKELMKIAKENSMLVEQSEATVLQLKQSKQDLENLRDKYDIDLEEASFKLQQLAENSRKEKESATLQAEAQMKEICQKHQIELGDLKKKCKEQESIIQQLQDNLENESENLMKAQKEVRKMMQSLDEAHEKNDEANKDFKQLKAKEEKLYLTLKELGSKIEKAETEMENSLEERRNLEEKHNALILEARDDSIERRCLEGRVQDLESQVSQMQEQGENTVELKRMVEELTRNNKELNIKCENAVQVEKEKLQEIEGLRSELAKAQDCLQVALMEKHKLEEECHDVQKKLQSLTESYESNLKNEELKCVDLCTQKEELSKILETTQLKLDQVEKLLSKQKRNEACLTQKLTHLETDLSSRDAKFHDLESVNTGLKLKLDQALNKVIGIENALEDTEKQLEIAQTECRDIHIKLLMSHDEVAKLHEVVLCKEKEVLESNNSKLQILSELETSRKNVSKLEMQISDIMTQNKNDMKKLENENQGLKMELAETAETLENFELSISQHKDQLKQFQQDCIVLQQNLESKETQLNSEIQELKCSLDEVQKCKVSLTAEGESFKLANENLSSEKLKAEDLAANRLDVMTKLEEEYKSLQVEQNQSNEKLSVMTERLQESKQNVESYKQKNQVLQQTLQEKEKYIESLSEEHVATGRTFSEKIEEMSQLHGDLKKKFKEKCEKLIKAEEVVDSLKSDKTPLNQKVEDLNLEIQKLNGQIELLQMDLEDKTELIEDLEQNLIPNLKLQIEKLNNTCNEKVDQVKELERLQVCNESELNNVKLDHVKIKEERNHFSQQCSHSDQKIHTLQQELDASQMSENELKLLLEILKSDFEKKRSENEGLVKSEQNLHDKVKFMEAAKEKHDETLKSIEIQSEEFSETCSKLKSENENLLSQHETLSTKLNEGKLLSESLRVTLDETKASHLKELDELEQQLLEAQTDYELMQAETERLANENFEMESKLSNHSLLCERFEEENLTLRNGNQCLTDELSIAAENLRKAEEHGASLQQMLNETLEKSKDNLHKLEEKLDSSQSQYKEKCEALSKALQDMEEKQSKCEDLENSINKLDDEVSCLKEINLNLTKQNDSAETTIGSLTKNIEILQSGVNALEMKITGNETQLREMSLAYQNQTQSLNEKLNLSEQEKMQLETQHQDVCEKLSKKEKENLVLQEDFVTTQQKLSDLQQICDHLRDDKVGLEEKLLSLQKSLDEESQSLRDHKQNLSDVTTKFEELNHGSKQTISALNLQIQELQHKVEKLDKENVAFADSCALKTTQIDEAIRQQNQLRDNLNQVMSQHKEALQERDALDVQVEKLKLDQESLTLQLDNATEEIAILHDSYNQKIQTEELKSKSVIDDLYLRNEKLCSEIQELKSNVSDMLTSIENASEELKECKSAKAETDQENVMLKSQKDTLEKQISEQTVKISNLQTEMCSLQSLNAKMESDLSEQVLAAKEKELYVVQLVEAHEKQKLQWQQTIDSVEQKLSELTVNLDARNDDVESLNQQLVQMEKEIAGKNSEAKTLLFGKQDLLKELSLLEKNLNTSETHLQEISIKYQNLKSSYENLSLDFVATKKLFEEKTADLTLQVSAKDAKILSQAKLIDEFQTESQVLSQQVEKLQKIIEVTTKDQQDKLAEKQNSIKTLENELQEVNETLDSQKADQMSIQNQYSALQKERENQLEFIKQMQQQLVDEKETRINQENDHQSSLNAVTNERNDLFEEICILETKHNVLLHDMETVQKQLVCANNSQKQATEKLENAEKERESVQKSITQTAEKIEKLESEVKAKTQRLAFVETELIEVESENEQLCGKTVDAEEKLQQMQTVLDDQQQHADKLMADFVTSEREKHKFQSKVSELTAEIEKLQQLLGDESHAKQSAVSNLDRQILEIEEKSKSVVEKKDSEIKKHVEEILELKESLSTIQIDLLQSNKHCKENDSILSSLNEMISQLEEQLENKTNQQEEKLSEVMSLVNKLKNVETENSALKNDLATDRSVIDDLKIQNQQLENSLDQFKTMSSDEKIALQKKVTQLSCQLSSQTSVLDALNNDMSAKVEEIFILKETIEKMTLKTEADSSKLGRVMQENLTLLSETKENDEKMLKYQTDLDELTTKCNKLQNKLDEHEEKYKDQLKALNVEKDNCKNDLKEMMFKNKELQTDINSLREEYEMLKSKFADSEEQQKQAVLKIAEYQHAQRDFIDAAALADKQITQVRTELELQLREKKEELVRSQKLIENKDLKLEQYESELKELKLSNQQLQTEFDTRKNESEELEKLKTSHMEQIDELNEQLDMLKDSKKNMDETNYALFLQIQDHEITMRDFQDEIESLKMGHKTETSDLSKKVNCLEEEVERLKEDLHEKIVLYNDSEFKLREAEDSVETKSKEIDHLSNETQALSVKYEDIKMEFENLKEERHQLSDGLQSMEDERRKFEEEEKQHQEEIELLEETISHKEQQLGKMREELTMMENVIADAESTQTQMTTQLKHLNDIIEQETAQHRKKVEDCETENETLLLEKQDLLQSLECLKIKQRLLDNDVKFRDNKICELEEQLNELGDKLSDAQDKSESWKTKCEGFKTQINFMEIDVTELECRLNEEREQCQQSETKFANANSQLMEMQEALDCVREKLQTERTKVSDGDQTIIAAKIQFNDEKQQLETEIQDLQLQLSSSKEALSATEKNFTNKMREMEAHCEKLRKQFELLHQQIHSLEESEKKLKNENVELKQVCEETNTEAKAKLESVLDDMKQLKSDVEKSENEKQILVEELEKATSQNIEHDNRYWDEIESKNVSLQKQVEQMKAKVQLVTNNARRKEKELLQLQAKLHKMEQSNNVSYVETRSRSKPSLPPSESSSVPSNSSRSLHEGSNTGRRKSTRLSRKSGRKSVGKPAGNKTPPKKSKMTDEGSVSSSPQFSVEGLPHLVNQGFTNIPVGFSSPFVMRRQQLSHTTKLVAAAMAKKNGGAERAEDKRTMQLRSRKKASRSPSQLSVTEPLRQLTNSPKPPSTASSGGSQRANEDDPDCKVQ